MKKLTKKFAVLSAMSIAAVQLGTSGIFSTFAAGETSFPYTIEAEDMKGAELWTDIYGTQLPDYSGKGFAYLTGGTISCNVTVAEDGMYLVTARCAQILNQEGRMETLSVNGSEFSKTIPYTEKWQDFEFGVVRLNKGENTLEFLNKYGYMAVDTVTVKVAEKHDYTLATDVLVDKNASESAKSLMKYLKSVYGSHIISGQQEIYGSGHKDNYEWENEFLMDLTGKMPAIRGLDFMNYNPLYGWDDGTTDRAVKWVKENNGIITASWHLNVPIDFENYTVGDAVDWQKCTYKNYQASNSTFNTANILKEGTKEREYYELAMKMLAEQFAVLQENGVPIIFRPLHEAQGNEGLYPDGTSWFWWGDRGPEVYKELWKLLFTTLTEKYELHNIIWEFNSYDYENSSDWYPGDEYVDIVAYDKYNVEYNRGDGKSSGPNLLAIPAKFDSLFKLTKGKKMVAMAENDTVPALDNILVEDAGWLYFCPWYDGGEDGGTAFLGENYQDYDELTKMYQSDYCITLDELPKNLYTSGNTESKTTSSSVTTAKTTTTTASTTITSEIPQNNVVYGDSNCDGKLNMADVVLIMQALVNPDKYGLSGSDKSHITAQGWLNADCCDAGNGVTNNDALAVQKYLLDLVKLPEVSNIA